MVINTQVVSEGGLETDFIWSLDDANVPVIFICSELHAQHLEWGSSVL